MNKIKLILGAVLIFFITTILFLSLVKGQKGNPIYYQTARDTRVGGPFEASNSTSRFALTEEIILNKSFILSRNLAAFASPDVVFYKGKFISIFTPGVSFIGIPFYLLGRLFNMPQLFTYLSTILFAIANIFLITKLATKLGSSNKAGLIAGFIFAFATNALIYSLSFTQHIFSTSIILIALLNAFGERNLKNNILFGIFFGTGMLLDIPNAFFLVPMGIYILKNSIHIEQLKEQGRIVFDTALLGLLIGILPLILIFGWYNYQTSGSYTQLAQRIGRTNVFDKGMPPQLQAKGSSASQPQSFNLNLHLTFQTRSQLTGMYILLISDERSWIYYCPVVFIGILGFFLLYKKDETRGKVLIILSVIILNILLYSMFDDPWGGWAFGPRYLIPSAALLSLMIAPALDKFKKNPLFIIVFGLLLYYSLWISFLGALTTSSIPPKVEAIDLPTHIPYTYLYNKQLIHQGMVSSLFYNLYLVKAIDPENYWKLLVNLTFGLFTLAYLFLLFTNRNLLKLIRPVKNFSFKKRREIK